MGSVRVRALPFADGDELEPLLQTQLFSRDTEALRSTTRTLRLKDSSGDDGATPSGLLELPKAGKDKDRKPPKESLLCVTVKRGNRVRLHHVQYKYAKGRFTIEQTWRLDDLRRFDGENIEGCVAIALEFGSGGHKVSFSF